MQGNWALEAEQPNLEGRDWRLILYTPGESEYVLEILSSIRGKDFQREKRMAYPSGSDSTSSVEEKDWKGLLSYDDTKD